MVVIGHREVALVVRRTDGDEVVRAEGHDRLVEEVVLDGWALGLPLKGEGKPGVGRGLLARDERVHEVEEVDEEAQQQDPRPDGRDDVQT